MTKEYRYTLVAEDGSKKTWAQKKMNLDELQGQVRGDIEMPPRDFWPNIENGHANVYSNELAKLEGMGRNLGFPVTPWGDYLSGPVLVEEVEPKISQELRLLDAQEVRRITNYINVALKRTTDTVEDGAVDVPVMVKKFKNGERPSEAT